jgi:diamine N-acetyltransferase
VEFKRIVVNEKGSGFGHEAVRLVKREVFERYRAHRLWLDVFEHNQRAKALYLSEGFKIEGMLREHVKGTMALPGSHVHVESRVHRFTGGS